MASLSLFGLEAYFVGVIILCCDLQNVASISSDLYLDHMLNDIMFVKLSGKGPNVAILWKGDDDDF